MKRQYKILSMLLTICMLFSVLTGFTSGVSMETTAEKAEGEIRYYDKQTAAVDECEILRYVNETEFKAKNHVFRVPEQETLNTYVFQNADGTRTVYFLDEDVKYVNDEGKIIEKDLSLVADGQGYGTAQNNVGLTIPDNPHDGIILSHLGHTVTITPITDNTKATAVKKDNSIIYPDLFGTDAGLKYTPLLSGVKEDVILSSYIPNAACSFTLDTNGLYLCVKDGKYFLSETTAGQPLFRLGDVITYDAVGKPSEGIMTVETVSEGSKYTVTVAADEAFLSDPETVYPVTIDPSVTVSDNTHGADAIEDAPIFSGYPDRNYATYLYNRLGTPDSSYGIGRTVVKLSGLISSGAYTGITAGQITNVSFYAKDASGGSGQFINLYQLTGGKAWTESTVTWNKVGSYIVSANYGATMGNGGWTEFNITNLVKAWKNGAYSADSGFLMMNQNEANNKCFYSSEYSASENRPYVVMTYNPDGFTSATDLSLNTYHSVSVTTGGEKKYFKFTPSNTGFYTFESSSNTGDPYAWLYNSNRQQLKENDDGAGNYNFRLTYHFVAGQEYYLKAGYYENDKGSFSVRIFSTTVPGYLYVSADKMIFDNNAYYINNISSGVKLYRFTPSKTGEYLFYSTGSSDSKIWMYNSNLNPIGENDDSGGYNNFRLSITLTAGSTYYIVAGHYGTKSGSYQVNMLSEINLYPGACHLRNVSTLSYLDIHGPIAQEYVHQWTYHTGSQEKWTFIKGTDGYYVIRSEYGNKYYVGISSTSIGFDNVRLFSDISSNTKWKIYTNSKGELFLEPMNAVGKVLYAPDTLQGSELQLEWISSSVGNRNKWKFECRFATPLEGQRWSKWCWATSARMLAQHYTSQGVTRTQNEAVSYIYGSEVDYGAWENQSKRAVQFYMENVTSNSLNLQYAISDGTSKSRIYSESNLRRFLDDGHTVFITRSTYNGTQRIGGHSTIVIGYTTVYINGNLEFRYIINDPWPDPGPSTWKSPVITQGQTYEKSYQWICNGRNAQGGEKPDPGIWEGYVTVVTSYSDITLQPVRNN